MAIPKKILVAYDFSDDSRAALHAALDLGRRFGAEVHLVHVTPRHLEILSPYDMHLPPPLAREMEETARVELEKPLAEIRAAGLGGEVHIREGDASDGIAAEAERLGADLVVMGTRGHSGLRRLVLGSVAERTLRVAPCPVLTVKGQEA